MKIPEPLAAIAASLTLIASARAATFTVINTADDGPGSVRQMLAEAALAPGADTVIFLPALSGQTATLLSEIAITDAGGVTVDATPLPGGLKFGIGGLHRHFAVGRGASVSFLGLTLSGGKAPAGGGGAIVNYGTLTLTRCALTGNSAGFTGGAILSCIYGPVPGPAALTVSHCTLSDNSAGKGGAIFTDADLTLSHCTFHGNSATFDGGAIYNDEDIVSMTHCTVYGNSAGDGGGAIGGYEGILEMTHCTVSGNSSGIFCVKGNRLALVNCIVAGNTSAAMPGVDIAGDRTAVVFTGINIVQSHWADSISGSPPLTTAPLLAPLGDYGGPTHTMALKPGSPARNAATGSTVTTDQRGFPTIGTPDIGAYEAGTPATFNAWAIETTGSTLAFGSDLDSDGAPDGLEYALRSNPSVPDGALLKAPAHVVLQPGDVPAMSVSFPYQRTATDLRYILQLSTDLTKVNGWTAVVTFTPPNTFTHLNGVTPTLNVAGETATITDPTIRSPAAFWRLVVQSAP